MRFLTAIPVYNEERYLEGVLKEACQWSPEILVVDDGSTDRTPELLSRFPSVRVLRHRQNEGYGAALRDAFRYAVEHGYDAVVTMDCDGQHEPSRIPHLLAALEDADIASGSRYLVPPPPDAVIPPDRRRINQLITRQLNELLGLNITDAFCGFKAYRRRVLEKLEITEAGYAMPLEVWVQVARYGWRVQEVPVPVLYLELERAFGGALDDPRTRLRCYRQVLARSLQRWFSEREWKVQEAEKLEG
jgi:glycosyltransferase involved in cell wall biosynthesis